MKLAVILLIVFTLTQCKVSKTYDYRFDGSDHILNGSVQKDILIPSKNYPGMRFEYGNYKPDSQMVRQLKAINKEIYVVCIGGTWCSDTQRELPRFLKIMDAAGVPASQLELLMVDKDKQCRYFNVKALGLDKVPTFIFYKNGKEIGRIIESCEMPLEQKILSFYIEPHSIPPTTR